LATTVCDSVAWCPRIVLISPTCKWRIVITDSLQAKSIHTLEWCESMCWISSSAAFHWNEAEPCQMQAADHDPTMLGGLLLLKTQIRRQFAVHQALCSLKPTLQQVHLLQLATMKLWLVQAVTCWGDSVVHWYSLNQAICFTDRFQEKRIHCFVIFAHDIAHWSSAYLVCISLLERRRQLGAGVASLGAWSKSLTLWIAESIPLFACFANHWLRGAQIARLKMQVKWILQEVHSTITTFTDQLNS